MLPSSLRLVKALLVASSLTFGGMRSSLAINSLHEQLQQVKSTINVVFKLHYLKECELCPLLLGANSELA